MSTARAKPMDCSLACVGTLVLEEADRHPEYRSLVVLSTELLIIVDLNSCQLKLYSRLSGKILATSDKFQSVPHDVCVVDGKGTEIAVVLLKGLIEILSVESTGQSTVIKHVRTVDVQRGFKYCHAVKALKSGKKLVVSGRKLDKEAWCCWGLVSLGDGQILTNHRMFKDRGYNSSNMATSADDSTVYISYWSNLDSHDNGVHAYGIMNGKRKFVYRSSDMKRPEGIAVDGRGYIYVCVSDPPCIHQLTEGGELVTVHRKFMPPRPTAMYWEGQQEGQQGRLHVTSLGNKDVWRFLPVSSDRQGTSIPVEILNMDNKSIQLFEEALQKGKEKVHNIRVMVVGQFGVGKTTLIKRLLGDEVDISRRVATEGIDVYVHCCDVSLADYKWTPRQKDSEQNYRLQRLAKVLKENQSTEEKVAYQKQVEVPSKREQTSVASKDYAEKEKVEDTEKEVVKTPPQDSRKNAHDPLEDKNTKVPYIPSHQQDLGQDFSSPASQQDKPPTPVIQRNLTKSDTYRSEPGEDVSTESHKKDLTREIIKVLRGNADKLPQDTGKYAPLSLWDFAGHFAFYTTHQTFLTRRAIYLLVSNLSGQVTDHVKEYFYFDSEGEKECQVQELAEVWLNSIHSCAPSPESGIPPVILVGTHMDKISQKQSPGKGTETETQVTAFQTEVTLPTTSTQTVKGDSQAAPVSSMTGAHAFPARDQSKTKEKFGFVQKVKSMILRSFGMEPMRGKIEDADKEKTYRREVSEGYFKIIRTYLQDKPTRFHLVDEDFAIDNTVVDNQLEKLKKKIIEVASKQPYWGEEQPTRWIPLEQEMMRLKDAGIKVIPRSLVEDLNDQISTDELDLFLKFHHDIGTILYFRLKVLEENIVLEPQWMIDALKSLITADEMFVRRSIPAVSDKWSEFNKDGKLSPELIDSIWTKEKYPDFHDNKNHILLLMEQLNIIAKPRIYTENMSEIKVEDYFLAPCMLHQKTPEDIICPVPHNQTESSPVLCYVFTGRYLPFPIFHRLLAACVAHWPLATRKKEATQQNLIFCGCGVFQLDESHQLTLHFRYYIIFVRVTRQGISDKTPSSKLCTEVREFIDDVLIKIIGNLSDSLKFEQSIQCPKYNGDSVNSLIPVSRLKEKAEVRCDFHNNMIESCSLLKYWFEDQVTIGDPSSNSLPCALASDRNRFMCIASLLVDVGSVVLRQLVHCHTVTPTSTLDNYLAKNRSKINSLPKRVLNQHQIDILFPPNGDRTNLEDYDITLLSALLNNIIPSLSLQERNMINDLRDDRNKLYAHTKSCKMNVNEYNTCLNSISSTLIALSKQCKDAAFEVKILQEIQRIQVSAIPAGSYLDILTAWFSRIEDLESRVGNRNKPADENNGK